MLEDPTKLRRKRPVSCYWSFKSFFDRPFPLINSLPDSFCRNALNFCPVRKGVCYSFVRNWFGVFRRYERGSEGFFYRPLPSVDTKPECIIRDSKMFRPLDKRSGLSLKSYPYCTFSVAGLFRSGGKSTVFLAIMSVVINAFNRGIHPSVSFKMFQIQWQHIVSKFFKRLPHAFNTTPAITRIAFIFRVITDTLYP